MMTIDFAFVATLLLVMTAIGVGASHLLYGRPVVDDLKDRVAHLEGELKEERAHNSERVERIRALEQRPDMTALAAAITDLGAMSHRIAENATQGLTLLDLHTAITAHNDQSVERDRAILGGLREIRDYFAARNGHGRP